MLKSKSFVALTALATAMTAQAGIVAHFSMDVKDGRIYETVSGDGFEVEGNFEPDPDR